MVALHHTVKYVELGTGNNTIVRALNASRAVFTSFQKQNKKTLLNSNSPVSSYKTA